MSEAVSSLTRPSAVPNRRISSEMEMLRSASAAVRMIVMAMILMKAEASMAEPPEKLQKDEPTASAGVLRGNERAVFTEEALQSLRHEIRALDSNEYAVRQAANRKISGIINGLLGTMNPLPQEIRNALNPRDEKGAYDRNNFSLEQCVRLEHALGDLERQSLLYPERLMPMEGYLNDVVLQFSEQTGFRVMIDPAVLKMHGQSPFTVERKENDWGSILRKICTACDAEVQVGHASDELRIVPRTGEGRTMVCNGHMLVLFGKKDDQERRAIDIRQTPQSGAIVSVDDIQAYDVKLVGAVSVAPLAINGEWTFSSGGYKPVRSKPAPTRTEKFEDIGHVVLRGAAVSHRETKPLNLEMNAWTTIGPQQFQAEVQKVEGSETWEVIVHASIYGDVPWPATPVPVDTKTYGMLDSCVYELKDDKGQRIFPNGPVRTRIDQRQAHITIPVDRKPTSAQVHAFTELELETVTKVPLVQE